MPFVFVDGERTICDFDRAGICIVGLVCADGKWDFVRLEVSVSLTKCTLSFNFEDSTNADSMEVSC